jgi:hypothetical protein
MGGYWGWKKGGVGGGEGEEGLGGVDGGDEEEGESGRRRRDWRNVWEAKEKGQTEKWFTKYVRLEENYKKLHYFTPPQSGCQSCTGSCVESAT